MTPATRRMAFLGGYALFIVVLAMLPERYVPGFLSFSPDLNHIATFLVMGILLRRSTDMPALRIALALFAFGLAIEGLQLLGGYREFSLHDIACNLIGITLYLAANALYGAKRRLRSAV